MSVRTLAEEHAAHQAADHAGHPHIMPGALGYGAAAAD
jgi:hypothetical protein